MEEQVSFCCCCAEVLDDNAALVPIVLTLPGEEPMTVATVVCYACEQDYERMPLVIEALINARIIRLKFPDKTFTPPANPPDELPGSPSQDDGV